MALCCCSNAARPPGDNAHRRQWGRPATEQRRINPAWECVWSSPVHGALFRRPASNSRFSIIAAGYGIVVATLVAGYAARTTKVITTNPITGIAVDRRLYRRSVLAQTMISQQHYGIRGYRSLESRRRGQSDLRGFRKPRRSRVTYRNSVTLTRV